MTVKRIESAYKTFTDLNGKELDNGKIYIGENGLDPETNPVSVYFDAALSVAASRPIRTIQGYISNDGSVADIYTANNYSITVRDKNDNLIYTKLSSEFLETQTIDVNAEYPSIADLVAFLNSNLSTDYDLLIDTQTYTLDSTATLPTNARKIIFGPGGSITFGAYDLTLSGQEIDAPDNRRIFVYNSTGLLLGGMKNQSVKPEWWGADPSTTDLDTTAIQAANAYLRDQGILTPAILDFGQGTYFIDDSIEIQPAVWYRGVGSKRSVTQTDPNPGTAIVLKKDINKPIFFGDNVFAGTRFTGMRIIQEEGSTASVVDAHGIFIDDNVTTTGFGELAFIDDCAIYGMGGDGVRFNSASTPLLIGKLSLIGNAANGIWFEGENFGKVHVQELKGDNNGVALLKISSVSRQGSFYIESIGSETTTVAGQSGHLDQVILLEDNVDTGFNFIVDQIDVRVSAATNSGSAIIRSKSTVNSQNNPSPRLMIRNINYVPFAPGSYDYIYFDENIEVGDSAGNSISTTGYNQSQVFYNKTLIGSRLWNAPNDSGIHFMGMVGNNTYTLAPPNHNVSNDNLLRINHPDNGATKHDVGFFDSNSDQIFKVDEGSINNYTDIFKEKDGVYSQETLVSIDLAINTALTLTINLGDNDFAGEIDVISSENIRHMSKYSLAGNISTSSGLTLVSNTGDNPRLALGNSAVGSTFVSFEVANCSSTAAVIGLLRIKLYHDGTAQPISSIAKSATFTTTIVRPELTPGNVLSDTGTPEGVVVAPIGAMFLRKDGGASTTLYIKESGTGNTGWVAK